jgi:hypothetical protein
MRNLFLILCLVLGMTNVFSATSPMEPHVEKAFNELNSKKVAVAKLNVTTALATNSNVQLGVYIPGGSSILNVYAFIREGFVSNLVATANSLAIGCVSTNDLIALKNVDPLATYSLIQGIPNNATANAIYVSSTCQVNAFVGPGINGLTDGQEDIYIEYLPNK